jgi:predicted GIY-YIG superfamily endonuclease
MSLDIDWKNNFYGISWAYEKDRLVVSTVFEDKKEAMSIAKEIEDWSDKFTRLTIIEKENDEFAICVYQDPGKVEGMSKQNQ